MVIKKMNLTNKAQEQAEKTLEVFRLRIKGILVQEVEKITSDLRKEVVYELKMYEIKLTEKELSWLTCEMMNIINEEYPNSLSNNNAKSILLKLLEATNGDNI